MIVDLVLAAGRGTRVGGTKSLLDLGGKPLLTRLLDEVLGSTVSSVIVVLGAEAERVIPLTRRSRVHALFNPDFRSEQLLSLKLALKALPQETRGFMIHPVDHCLVKRHHLDALVTAFDGRDQSRAIVRPRHAGVWGHPVLYAAPYAQEFLALPVSESGRAVYRRHLDEVVPVEFLDADCQFDLDTPEDLATARGRFSPASGPAGGAPHVPPS
jgi:molybdenum cofactor cytidylyltransferase